MLPVSAMVETRIDDDAGGSKFNEMTLFACNLCLIFISLLVLLLCFVSVLDSPLPHELMDVPIVAGGPDVDDRGPEGKTRGGRT